MSNEMRPTTDTRTLFEILEPWEVEEEVYRAEREILESLKEPAFIRTGIDNVDYLVDQWRFARAGLEQGKRRGLHGPAALARTACPSRPAGGPQGGPQCRR